MQMTNTRHYSFNRKALSIVLTLVMALSYVGLLSGVFGMDLFGTKQTANAAEGANNYSWTVKLVTTDDCDAYNDNSYVTLYFKKANGTGEDWTKNVIGYGAFESVTTTTTTNANHTDIPAGYFPYKVQVHLRFALLPGRNWKGYCNLTTPAGTKTTTEWEWKSSWSGGNTETKDIEVTGNYPYVNACTWSNANYTSVDIPLSGNAYVDKTFQVSEIKDQYGVKWQNSVPTFSISGGNATISADSSDGTKGNVRFNNNSGVDYTAKIGAAWSSANSSHNPATLYHADISVHAKHTLTVKANGGNWNGSTTDKTYYGHTDDTQDIPEPKRTGYTFDGWTVSGGSVSGNTYTFANRNTSTLTAKWTLNDYTATFLWDNVPNKYGNVDPSAKKRVDTYHITDSGDITFPNDSDLAKDYYTFNGYWKVEDVDGESSWSIGNTVYTPGSSIGANQYGNVTFRAQYTPIPYTITFDPNGGSEVQQPGNANANTYDYNYESTDALPISTRLGYILTWVPSTTNGYWQQGEHYAPGTALAEKHGSVHMVASWESRTSKVYLTLGTGVTIPGGLTEYGYSFASGCTIPNKAVRIGYTFTGWKVTGVPSDAQYNAAVTETVNGVQGLGNPPAANRWVLGTVYTPESDGRTFLPSDKFGDVTLTPQWEHIQYTITYNGNNGTTPDNKNYYIDSTTFTLPTSTRNGYTFNGWTVDTHDDVYNWTDSSYASGYSVSGKYGNVTLKADWLPTDYDITLDVNGGDALTDTTLPYKITESTSLPPSPTRTGYTFTGWKVVAPIAGSWVEGTVYSGSAPAAPAGNYGNLKLQAQWTPTAYTISKTTNGGSNGASVTYHINDAAFTLGASVLAGYNFVNWTVDADAGNWHQNDAYGANTSISGKWGDVDLTANFTPITYTITYKDKDGETQYVDTYTIEDAVEIDDYAVPGYTFGGWIVSGFDAATGGGWPGNGETMSAGTLSANMYYGNITLTPILTAKSYTVTYDFNGAPATCGNLPYTIESTDELPGNDSANPPTKTGHNFSGWKVVEVGDEGNWTLNAVIPGNTALTGKYGSVKLQAQWTPKNYTITYITGTYPDGITKQGTYGQPAPDLTDAEKAKPADAQYTYTFDHWDPSLATVTGEKTYRAVYSETLNKYDITWMIPDDVNGTLTNYTATVTPNVEFGTAPVYNNGVNPELASDNPSEYEWRFAGWSLTEGGAKLESIPAVTGVATYYALFTKVLAPEQVIWDIEGVTNTELWGIGEIPEWRHDTPTKADANGYKYTFTHWDPTPVAVVQHGGPYTYTAVFSSSLQDYTVTLKLNGGAMSDPLTMDYQMGDTLTFPTPEKTGYTFAGWLLDEAVGSWAVDTTVPAGSFATGTKWGNVSFTAQWTPIEYTVTFAAASEDDILPADLTYTIESTNALPTATREGHTLSGWLISVGGGNWTQGATVAAAYSLLENYGNVTLTPMWQVNTYTLTWISGDYTETSEAEYGSAILAYAPLTRQGYSAAWDQEVPAAMPAQNLTFRAVYTATDYYVRLYVNGGSALDNFYYTIEGCSENQTPTFDTLPTPTREGATFTGWKVTQAQGNWIRNAIVNGGASLIGKFGNVTLTAQWELETHTVTWVAGDVTKEAVWLYGATPSYDGTPYKSPDETNSYVFREWDKEIVPVTEDVTYTALFDSIERTYTVIWNIDGATTTQYYHYGDTPTYPGATDPVRPSTYEYDFTFSGWSPAVADVTKDVTYTAQFDVFTKLQGLSIDVSSLFLAIGANDTVTAQIYPATATVRDVVWTSKNTDVATIDSAGTVTAVSPGVALINVSSVDKSFNAYCVVTVAPTHTSYVAISAGGVSTTQLPGSLLQLTATLQPENATDTGITWSSGDLSVATVDNTGLVRFVGVGETDITAMASDGFSLGSIHVVTTSDESEVEDNVKTYRITFGSFNGGFKFAEDGEVYTEGFCNVPEGETLRFKLNVEDADQGKYSVYVNGRKLSYGSDYWYALENVDANAVISIRDSAAGVGIPEQQEDNSGLTFFQKLAAFLRKIVEFFRGIFNK